DHVLLQAAQVVDLAGDRRFREDARRLLEGGRGDERVGGERRLGDPQQQGTSGGRLLPGVGQDVVRRDEPELVHHLVDEELAVPHVLHLHPAHHLPDDDLDVLVVDVHALQPVDLLDLVHQVPLQLLLAAHAQDVVRIDGAVHQGLARLDPFRFLHVDVRAAGELVLALVVLVRGHEDLAVLLGDVAVLHDTVDLRDDGRLLGTPGLEQLDHAGQTARDVLRLGRLARDLGQHVAGGDGSAVLDHEVRAGGEQVLAQHLALLVADLDARLLLLVRGLHDDRRRHPGVLVHLLVYGLAVDDVAEADLSALFGEDRERVGVPLHEELSLLDVLAVLDLELGAVDDRVALALAALLVLDDERARAVHDHQVALLVLDRVDVVELHAPGVLRLQGGLLAVVAGGSADVERAHGELRARLADGLGGDDAHGHAHLHQLAGGEVAAVAEGAHAPLGLAGQDGANAHLLDPGGLDRGSDVLRDLVVDLHDDAAAERVLDVLQGDPPHDAVAKRLDHLARFDDGPDVDAVHGAAVVLGDDHVLAHVHQAPREVTRVRRLQRGVRETLAGAVG